MLLPILSLPTKEIVREHTPPKPKRSRDERISDLELNTDPDDDDLGDESQNSAAIGLRSILDCLWVPCLLEHASVIQWVKTLIDLIFLFTKHNLHYVGQQG
jgi:hypothetical protein